MSSHKTQFQVTYDKTIKFYDFHYHLHKSTFKGLRNIFKEYSDCEKQYSSRMVQLTQSISSEIPDLALQMPSIRTCIKDFVESVSTFSQLHLNYAQRLNQISSTITSEYTQSKKLKQKHMKLLKEHFGDSIYKVRQSGIKKNIISQEAHICKKLYEHLDVFAEQEAERTQKLKEQVLIYFALTKKICQKQVQVVGKYKLKVSQQEAQVKILQIDQISESLIKQYNSYEDNNQLQFLPQDRLTSKNYDKVQTINLQRQSLNQSTILKERADNLDTFKSRIKESQQKYEQLPQKLKQFRKVLAEKHRISGIFDQTILQKSYMYTNLIKSDIITLISFDMLSSFYAKDKSSQKRLLLSTIKANLKLKGQIIQQNCKNVSAFAEKLIQFKDQMQLDETKSAQNKDYKFHLILLLILNEIYISSQNQNNGQAGGIQQKQLLSFLKERQFDIRKNNSLKNMNEMHPVISCVIVKKMLQALIIVQQDEPLIFDDFLKYFELIAIWAQSYFIGMDNEITKLLFLELIETAIRTTKHNFVEQIELLCQEKERKRKSQKGALASSKRQSLNGRYDYCQTVLIACIASNVTQGIINFFELRIPLINFFKILNCLESIIYQTNQSFYAVEYFNKCLKRSGLTYIYWSDEEKKIIEPSIWQGELRLKNMVEALQQLQFKAIEETHFYPTSVEMAQLIGVDQKIILDKLKNDFTQALGDIIENNLNLLSEEKGVDKEGYVLKLGVYLAQMDIVSHKSFEFQKKYLKVLDLYLTSTQKEYTNLLDHSRKTELWIMEENSMATQNCIDFCSLLYKPFQFLLNTLKILQQKTKNAFTQKFSQFIKNKLNNILKDHICKYIIFLDDSLKCFYYEEPEIHYKPKKADSILNTSTQQKNKMTFQFKEVVRRIYNLKFLKSQLDEILNDFLPEEIIFHDIGGSIFNLERLQYSIGKNNNKQYQSILLNLKEIVLSISNVEQTLINRVGDITVFHFMRRFFFNLYFQESKSTFQEFFSSKSDYKLSPFTMIQMQQELQQIFAIIQKHIPTEISEQYFDRLMHQFFKALKYQMINSSKFKISKSKEEIVSYLEDDVAFVCTMLKQKHVPQKYVQNNLERPIKHVLELMKSSTKELIRQCAQIIDKNTDQCKCILILLYLRPNDQKAVDFFKKYKSTVFI